MPALVLDDVVVTAPGDDDVVVLHATSLRITERRVAVVGANGSGKSTLARLLNGLARPASGRVTVDGLDTVGDGAAVRRRVGFCFTDPGAQLVMPTAAEDVALSLRRTVPDAAARRARAVEVLDRFGLGAHADVSVAALSGGQRQLLALAGVRATAPDVVVADEPTTLLDRRNARVVGDLLLGLEQQLVLVTHDLDLASRCERVLVVDGGRVVRDGEPHDAIAAYCALVDAR